MTDTKVLQGTAPYNFVPLNKVVIKPYNEIGEIPNHAIMDEEYHSGEISVSVEVLNDIFISDGEKEHPDFFKNNRGEYAIPGSSFRGLIRNNMQILGLSAIGDDVEDYRIMYRKVGAKKSELTDEYKNILGIESVKSISVTKNVKAGYIVCEAGKYYIYKTKGEDGLNGKANYYPLRETVIFKSYDEAKDKKNYPFGLLKQSENDTCLMHNGTSKDFVKKEKRIINNKVNNKYKSFYMQISYDLKDNSQVIGISKPGDRKYEGYVISSNQIGDKKTIYIVPEIDKSDNAVIIPISESDIKSFKVDYENKKNLKNIKEAGDYYKLPKEGEEKPVFYIYDNQGNLCFGFTPYLRVFYNHSIKEGMPEAHKKNDENDLILDFTNSILGFTSDKYSFKSRVAFENLILESDEKINRKEYSGVLGSPKASSYREYIKQKPESETTYNTDGFEIRGIKQYWLRNQTVELSKGNGNENVMSKLRPIGKGNVFTGKVRYKNLTDVELGLLLWSLSLEPDCFQNIGMGKAYGLGKINVKLSQIKEQSLSSMYNGIWTADPYNIVSHDEQKHFIEKCKEFILKSYNESSNNKNPKKNITDISSIQAFVMMKKAAPEADKIKYMSLDEYSNQSRKPLQTVREIAKGDMKDSESKEKNQNNNNHNSKNSRRGNNSLGGFGELKNFKL
jgi:CRISPR-associated protein (TIGR03986 family)